MANFLSAILPAGFVVLCFVHLVVAGWDFDSSCDKNFTAIKIAMRNAQDIFLYAADRIHDRDNHVLSGNLIQDMLGLNESPNDIELDNLGILFLNMASAASLGFREPLVPITLRYFCDDGESSNIPPERNPCYNGGAAWLGEPSVPIGSDPGDRLYKLTLCGGNGYPNKFGNKFAGLDQDIRIDPFIRAAHNDNKLDLTFFNAMGGVGGFQRALSHIVLHELVHFYDIRRFGSMLPLPGSNQKIRELYNFTQMTGREPGIPANGQTRAAAISLAANAESHAAIATGLYFPEYMILDGKLTPLPVGTPRPPNKYPHTKPPIRLIVQDKF